jgi:hypothetical protein
MTPRLWGRLLLTFGVIHAVSGISITIICDAVPRDDPAIVKTKVTDDRERNATEAPQLANTASRCEIQDNPALQSRTKHLIVSRFDDLHANTLRKRDQMGDEAVG